MDSDFFKDPEGEKPDAPAKPDKPIEKRYTETGDLEVVLSPRVTATLRELTGWQSMQADSMIGDTRSSFAMAKTYAIFALKGLKINGVDSPLGKVVSKASKDSEIASRASMLTAREITVLMAAYAEEFMGDPNDEEALKNS